MPTNKELSGMIEGGINENLVKQQITGWITGYVGMVRWEKKTHFGHHTFSVDGHHKPDMIICYRDQTVAIEVKTSKKSKNVYDAFPQIIDYYDNVRTCYIDGKSHIITGYLVATDESLHGHLFDEKAMKTYETMSDSRKDVADRGFLPRNEYEKTEMFTRILWRMLDYMKIWRDGVFIGALLSSVLDDPGTLYPKILGKRGKHQFFEAIQK